jgi:hypothetical protein
MPRSSVCWHATAAPHLRVACVDVGVCRPFTACVLVLLLLLLWLQAAATLWMRRSWRPCGRNWCVSRCCIVPGASSLALSSHSSCLSLSFSRSGGARSHAEGSRCCTRRRSRAAGLSCVVVPVVDVSVSLSASLIAVCVTACDGHIVCTRRTAVCLMLRRRRRRRLRCRSFDRSWCGGWCTVCLRCCQWC